MLTLSLPLEPTGSAGLEVLFQYATHTARRDAQRKVRLWESPLFFAVCEVDSCSVQPGTSDLEMAKGRGPSERRRRPNLPSRTSTWPERKPGPGRLGRLGEAWDAASPSPPTSYSLRHSPPSIKI